MRTGSLAFLFCFLATSVFSRAAGAVLRGRECTIDSYDSQAESGQVGGFDGDSFPGVMSILKEKLRISGFGMRRTDPSDRRIRYFTDSEFLIELRRSSGRGSDGKVSLIIMNTGRFGAYQTVFFVEVPGSADPRADALSLIEKVPACVRQH